MADVARPPARAVLLVAAAAVALLVVVLLRGPVALVAAASVAVFAGCVLAVPPLLRDDGIDWDWLPERAAEVPPEPGIALLRRLLAPDASDTGAPAQLQDLVRAIAEERAAASGPIQSDGPLATYLGGPPRRLDLHEVETLITALEALPRRSSP